jgi:hypothetical protein
MPQPVGLSFEVAYEIPYVKLKNTHCQQALRAKRLLTMNVFNDSAIELCWNTRLAWILSVKDPVNGIL